MSKFCEKCGAPLVEGLTFCTSCGAPAKAPEDVSATLPLDPGVNAEAAVSATLPLDPGAAGADAMSATTPVDAVPPADPGATVYDTAPVYAPGRYPNNYASGVPAPNVPAPKKDQTKTVLIIAVAAVAVVAIIAACVLLLNKNNGGSGSGSGSGSGKSSGSSSQKDDTVEAVAAKLSQLLEEEDVDALVSMTTDRVYEIEVFEDKDGCKEYYEDMFGFFEDEVFYDVDFEYTVSIELKHKEKLSDERIHDFMEGDVDEDEIDSFYGKLVKYTVELTATEKKGDGEEKYDDVYAYFFKESGQWKLFVISKYDA